MIYRKYCAITKFSLFIVPDGWGKPLLFIYYWKKTNLKFKIDSGDNIRTLNVLRSEDFQLIKEYAEGYELIVIDEAQNIPGIRQGLKISPIKSLSLN